MTIHTYGPTAQSVRPANAGEVSVVDHDGTAVTLTTPVSVDGQGRVSFAVDDATAPHDIFVKVTSAATGTMSTERWHFGGSHAPGQLQASVKASVATLESAIAGWGSPSGTYSVGKDTALLAALNTVAALARQVTGQVEQR